MKILNTILRALYLTTHADNPYANENVISMQTLENIIFIVYFSSVYFIEQRHEHEYVKYDGEMNTGILKFAIIVVFNYTVHAHPVFDFQIL